LAVEQNSVNVLKLIGASLNEPHTSMTALHTHVCIYVLCLLVSFFCLDRPLTVTFK